MKGLIRLSLTIIGGIIGLQMGNEHTRFFLACALSFGGYMVGGQIFPSTNKLKYKHEKIGSPRTPTDEIPELLSILKDKNKSSSAIASARAKIEKIGPESCDYSQEIAQALVHENIKDSRIAVSIINALSNIGPKAKKGVPYLIEALDVADSDIQNHVEWSLKTITGKNYGKDKVKWSQWWCEYK